MNNEVQTPQEIAQLSNLSEALHAIYSDADMMKAYLSAPVTFGVKRNRALQCLSTARNPCYRFDLNKEDTAVVIPMIEAFLESIKGKNDPAPEYIGGERWRLVSATNV